MRKRGDYNMLKILSIKSVEEKFVNFESTSSLENDEFSINQQRKIVEKLKRKEALKEAKK